MLTLPCRGPSLRVETVCRAVCGVLRELCAVDACLGKGMQGGSVFGACAKRACVAGAAPCLCRVRVPLVGAWCMRFCRVAYFATLCKGMFGSICSSADPAEAWQAELPGRSLGRRVRLGTLRRHGLLRRRSAIGRRASHPQLPQQQLRGGLQRRARTRAGRRSKQGSRARRTCAKLPSLRRESW